MSGGNGKSGDPSALEAERLVIGALLIEPKALDDVADLVTVADFYDARNATLYATILALRAKNEPADLVTVCDVLRRAGNLANVGGAAAVSEMTDAAITAANVRYYAKLVADRALLRSLIDAARRIARDAMTSTDSVELIVDRAEAAIMAAGRRSESSEMSRLGDLLDGFFEAIEKARERGGEMVGTPTGFTDLDRILCGLEPEELIVLGARPSVGKSALASAIARNVAGGIGAAGKGKPVAIFSLEMSKEQNIQRLVAAEAGVSLVRLRSARLQSEEFPELARAFGRLSDVPIFLDDTAALSPLAVRAKARRVHRKSPLGLVVVDYVQLMTGQGDNREQEVSACSRAMKQLAKDLRCPVLLLAQLSREVEKRKPPIPRPSDLRESGSLEADADKIVFLYRPALWSEKARKEKPREAFALVAKNRNGPTGSCRLDFDPEPATFRNAAAEDAEEPPPEHWSE
jgi:replicative DNA helicase